MRVNIYSQELMLDLEVGQEPELGWQISNTGRIYSYIRMFLHSSDKLHHPPEDDDRSAITFWLPHSLDRREVLATQFEEMARLVRRARRENHDG